MNLFEKQAQVSRELMELNTQWFQKIAEFDTQNFQKYVETNQAFAQRLPEVRDVQTFVELQREYGETMWNSTTEVFKTRGELVREALAANGEVIKGAFNQEEAPAAKPKAKAEKAA